MGVPVTKKSFFVSTSNLNICDVASHDCFLEENLLSEQLQSGNPYIRIRAAWLTVYLFV